MKRSFAMRHASPFLFVVVAISMMLSSSVISVVECNKLTLVEFESNLQCENRTGVEASPSAVGDVRRMSCNSNTNTYTRAVYQAEVSGDIDTEPLSASHQFTVVAISSSADGDGKQSVRVADGCSHDRSMPNHSRAPECTKLELPLRTINGTFSLVSNRDLAQLLGLTEYDTANMIQGINVSVEFGHTRWAIDLEPTYDTVFPYGYSQTVNETMAAFDDAVLAAEQQGSNIGLARCRPYITEESGRVGGALDACFRAACNCSTYPNKPSNVPDFYTYELQWKSPVCLVRRISTGVPRLTTNATVRLAAFIKVNGTVVFNATIFKQSFDDITTATSTSAAKGNIGIGSGISKLAQRVYGSIGPFSLTFDDQESNSLTIDSQSFGGALTTPVIKLKVELSDSFVANSAEDAPRRYLGSTSDTVASTAFFGLAGGYIVDCLSDSEALRSPYRNSTVNPYSTFGLPVGGGAAPDKWFFMSDAVSRLGALFNPHLRSSCGLIGVSSAAIAFGGNSNSSVCCDGTLVDEACVPGSSHPNSFASPEEILNDGALWKQSFVPPGFNQYNYYMYGQNILYSQPVKSELTGLSPELYGASNAVFNVTLEFSDLIVRPQSGSSATLVSVPPIRVELGTSSNLQAYSSSDPISCVYNKDVAGNGVVVFQRVCNAASGAATANVSITFVGCTGLHYGQGANHTIPLDQGPIQLENIALRPGQCYDMFTLPIRAIDWQTEQPSCQNVHISATRGSTIDYARDAPLQCLPMLGIWNNPVKAGNSTLTIEDLDPTCSRCDSDDIACLDQCGLGYTSPWLLIFWIPLAALLLIVLVYVPVAIKGYSADKRLAAVRQVRMEKIFRGEVGRGETYR